MTLVHTPAAQVCPEPHARPPAPQFVVDASSAVSRPPAAEPLRSPYAASHAAITHAPDAHSTIAWSKPQFAAAPSSAIASSSVNPLSEGVSMDASMTSGGGGV